MTRNQNKSGVGDAIEPARVHSAESLQNSAEQSLNVPAAAPDRAKVGKPALNLAKALESKVASRPSQGSCEQRLWLTFFFDGTGNNLEADVGTQKHSNVAKLFRSHPENDSVNGIYRVYIPGVGTYFKEVGDQGGKMTGKAFGKGGDDRVAWALKRWDQLLSPHIARAANPSNKIVEINVAVFGFSRGATSARAFITDLFRTRSNAVTGSILRTKSGHPLRIRFMGLYDTVASVGIPMSTNNTSLMKAPDGARALVAARLGKENQEIWPSTIAFSRGGTPGADPSPGQSDGHSAYGGKIAIPDVVENVQHYIAAHELRNSFPVDSVSILRGGTVQRPEKFKEYVYPGVHSDVGGSYRPGEGGRAEDVVNKLGLIPLHHMYDAAIAAGVPLLPKSAWEKLQLDDFDIGNGIVDSYNHYMSRVDKGTTIGELMNAHMRLYYAWRFQDIAKKRRGDKREAEAIRRNEAIYSKEGKKLDEEIAKLEATEKRALRELQHMQSQRSAAMQPVYGKAIQRAELDRQDALFERAKENYQNALHEKLRVKAVKDALPGTGELEGIVHFYDEQLMRDAQSIRKVYGLDIDRKGPVLFTRKELRPHYKALMDAYENEFVNNAGLRDQRIIDFFDKYVHDSMSGFAKDASLPSDPRVVYVGEDNKLNYASRIAPSGQERMTA